MYDQSGPSNTIEHASAVSRTISRTVRTCVGIGSPIRHHDRPGAYRVVDRFLQARTAQPQTVAGSDSGQAATAARVHCTLVCLRLFFFTATSTPQAAQATGV